MDRKVISLADSRRRSNLLTKRSEPDLATRVADLEKDMLRCVEGMLELEQRLDSTDKFLKKLLHLLRDAKS